MGVALVVCGGVTAAHADEPARIADNSFLIEEAYNQEPGVIQHIQALQLMRGGAAAYSFTEEWPATGMAHQLSVTVPWNRLSDAGPSGVGDVLLNYRWQARAGDVACSPRLSAVLPTGDSDRGLGTGGWGVQVNLPMSVVCGSALVAHGNLGATWVPGASTTARDGASVGGASGGASLVWLARTNANVLLELAGSSADALTETGAIEREEQLWLNPGVRFAIDFASGLQVVPGVSVPVGIGPSAGERGVLLYLSLEHPAFGR